MTFETHHHAASIIHLVVFSGQGPVAPEDAIKQAVCSLGHTPSFNKEMLNNTHNKIIVTTNVSAEMVASVAILAH